jgi:hypothetical protein
MLGRSSGLEMPKASASLFLRAVASSTGAAALAGVELVDGLFMLATFFENTFAAELRGIACMRSAAV